MGTELHLVRGASFCEAPPLLERGGKRNMNTLTRGFVLPPSPFEQQHDPTLRGGRSRSKPEAGEKHRTKKMRPLTLTQEARIKQSFKPVPEIAEKYGISERRVMAIKNRAERGGK